MPWPFTSTSTASSSSPSAPASTADGAYIAPDRSARDKCWAARDGFFACLERAGIVDSIEHAAAAYEACGREEQDLRRECASSWVTYFKQRRVVEHRKKAMIQNLQGEGAKLLEGELPGLPPGVKSQR